jgi:hypothetical protein
MSPFAKGFIVGVVGVFAFHYITGKAPTKASS